ncbi:glycosyltransferase family 2 protein [Sphingomonas sp. CD22]|uniref:glycosyltransferase family 2 protein n=1 Tax=Sphingomonas sp. CD22 TaxID=3100214 RepID=UPI002ADF4255|nr:glycosyltransferase family 2 protein [Sphingomonas sp. CD22]MEA1085871.1 glycosyltransferase family 2 protein [Sphingomonas sp. CD22]
MSKVDVVIVNWNAGPQLRECVESIFAHEHEVLGSVIVVDNASVDGSATFCRTDDRVVLVEPERNLGFGTACNRGAAAGSADYLLFLNPDTQLLHSTLANVVDHLRGRGRAAGAVGVKLIGSDGHVSRHCARLPSAWTFLTLSLGLSKILPRWFKPVELVEFDHVHTANVPHVMGAFYLMPRAVFEAVGGFDERFFVFYEDLDLSLRIAQAGKSVVYFAEEEIFHRTGGTGSGASAKALSYLLESRLIYARKHFGAVGWVIIAFSVFIIEPVRRTVHALLRCAPRLAREAWMAERRLFAMVRGRAVDRR